MLFHTLHKFFCKFHSFHFLATKNIDNRHLFKPGALWFATILKSLNKNSFFDKSILNNREFPFMEKIVEKEKKKSRIFCFFKKNSFYSLKTLVYIYKLFNYQFWAAYTVK